MKRFLDAFGRDRVLFFVFEDFIKDLAGACRQTFRFLGVDESFSPRLERHNEGALPRSIAVQYFLRNSQRIIPWVRPTRVRMALCEAGLKLNLRLGSKEEQKIPADVYESLMRRYEPDIAALREVTGLDLSSWARPAR